MSFNKRTSVHPPFAKHSLFASCLPSFPTHPPSSLLQGVCTNNNANGFSTRRYSINLDGQGFPSGNCLAHCPASCAPWRQCIRPSVYQQYKQAGAGMLMEDMIGQCVRARQRGCFQ